MRTPPTTRYGEPFHWWGPGWSVPRMLGVQDLLRDGTIDRKSAALLWAVMARRRSLVVVGGPGGLGKTTLLTALCQLLPPTTTRLYARGCYETFAFLDDPHVEPHESALLINEISPHLPVYLWGGAVARMLDAAQRGFALYATAHGESLYEFVASLTGSPLRIPAASIAAFEYVVLLDRTDAVASGRQVRGVWRLRHTAQGLAVTHVIAAPEPDTLALPAAPMPHLPPFTAAELAWRYDALADSWVSGVPEIPWDVGLAPAPEPPVSGDITVHHP